MLHLYLLRHGQTEFNRQNIVQGGGVDSSLNETGLEQAELFYKHYQHIPFKAIVHTGLRRTKETVNLFSQNGIEFLEVPELNELSWGVIEGKEATPEVMNEFNRVAESWKHGDYHARIEGGESAITCWERVAIGLQKIQRAFPDGGPVLVCTHGRTMRVLLAGVTGYGLNQMHIFPHENTALNLLRLAPNGRAILEKLNDTSHLPSC